VKLEGVNLVDTYVIKPLRLGTIMRKKEAMSYQCGDASVQPFPLISYYLESANHKIIVDTGGDEPDGVKWMPYTRTEEESLENALKKIGVKCEDIDTVILTHMHWDHCCNNHLFPNARFVVQKKEYDFLFSPELQNIKGYLKDLMLQTEYDLIDGDKKVVDGISVVLAPGHSPGMQCVLVNTEDGFYILGGDLITLFENWEADPHTPDGVYYNFESMLKSIDKIDALGAMGGKLLPGHDEKVFQHKIYPHN
jgi:Zn-dependent hydrolases, including glyoxylases